MKLIVLCASAVLALGGIMDCLAVQPVVTIEVRNPGAEAVDLRVTDNDKCELGMLTTLQGNTQTTYDVDQTAGAFICVGGAAPAVKVEPHGRYELKGGTLVPAAAQ